MRSFWGRIINPLACAILTILLSGLSAAVISNWLHDRSSMLSAKRDVLRRFVGNRYLLTSPSNISREGEPFVALNEIFVVYAEHPQVIAALKKMHEELGTKGRLVDNIVTLTKAMAKSGGCVGSRIDRRVHLLAFHSAEAEDDQSFPYSPIILVLYRRRPSKGSAHIRVEIQHKDPFLSGPGRDRGRNCP